MATQTMHEPSGQYLVNHLIDEYQRTKLNVVRSNGAWIYSNYPEAIGKVKNGAARGLALADNNYYLNRQTVSGAAQIFFSHTNYTGEALRCCIQLYNSGSSTVTVKREYYGYSVGFGNQVKAVKDYFSSASKTITVAAKGTAMLLDPFTVSGGATSMPFTGMLRMNSSANIEVSIYVYKYQKGNTFPFDRSKMKAYDYNINVSADPGTTYPNVYTGRGPSYFLTFSHGTKTVSSLKSKPYVFTSNCNKGLQNTNEIIPITMLSGGRVADVSSSNEDLSNLGNWCAQNYNIITFKNDTNTTATIQGYVRCSNPVMNLNGNVKGAVELQKTWNWCTVTLGPGESHELQYQHICASYGAGASHHQWSVE